MLLRPVDETGDILPIQSSSRMLSGSPAVALLVKYRLSLLQGDWWENENAGFPALQRLQESRLTEADAQGLASLISAYIRETPGVKTVEQAAFSVTGRQFSYEASILTEEGPARAEFSLPF